MEWENINRRNLYRATNNADDANGFLVDRAALDRSDSLVEAGTLREDVSTRPPTSADSQAPASAAILVIGFALVVLSDHGSTRVGLASPMSPVTSVSAFLTRLAPRQGRGQA